MHLMFAAVGLKAPNIGVLDEESLAELRGLPQKNLGLEMLRKLLDDEIKARSRRSVVQARSFAAMLEDTLKRYQNRSLETAQVMIVLSGNHSGHCETLRTSHCGVARRRRDLSGSRHCEEAVGRRSNTCTHCVQCGVSMPINTETNPAAGTGGVSMILIVGAPILSAYTLCVLYRVGLT